MTNNIIFSFYADSSKIPDKAALRKIIERSEGTFDSLKTEKWVEHNGRKIMLFKSFNKIDPDLFPVDLAGQEYDIQNKIDQEELSIIQRKVPQVEEWEIPTFFADSWISLAIDKEKDIIIAYYSGMYDTDHLGRVVNIMSKVSIRPDYRGKRICTSFAKFTYEQVVQHHHVEIFEIQVLADERFNACQCYVQAAFDLGWTVYVVKTKKTFKSDKAKTCQIMRTSKTYEDTKLLFIVA